MPHCAGVVLDVQTLFASPLLGIPIWVGHNCLLSGQRNLPSPQSQFGISNRSIYKICTMLSCSRVTVSFPVMPYLWPFPALWNLLVRYRPLRWTRLSKRQRGIDILASWNVVTLYQPNAIAPYLSCNVLPARYPHWAALHQSDCARPILGYAKTSLQHQING